MGKAADWLREERRKTLGDWVAICLGCGHGQRYFAVSGDGEVEPACPTCGEAMLTCCPGCGAKVSSMFAVTCEGCGEALRAAEQFGTAIRRTEGVRGL